MRPSEQIETGSLPKIKAMEQALETIGGMDLEADDAPEFAANTANAAIGEVYHDTGNDE